ncbi:cytochrome c oxidase assembly factor 6 homolog [Octopus bimaculoides]|uniref:Cytochrome c oxidase assembly factor 6 n=1 Tax=Octopus bimaculoides TaxID=37653 RepID=A0A0L8I9L5_OCTBM|nr:cytochrome c oxidase assembly factor 6 homolog [Octopus bimaculoides]|eukprot:XP_014783737.1 PREDICTED: cytochrome c oxidase assembly factor 6 homolog [Octopus bimaculoides]
MSDVTADSSNSRAPTQSERQKCWTARDMFWTCLDGNEASPLNCQAVRKTFEESCSKTWVKYFDRRREYLKFKAKLEQEQSDPVDNVKL